MLDQLVEIEDDDELYRRVFRYCVTSERVSSAAFKDRRKKPANRFSVDCARLTTPTGSLARGKPGQLLIGLLALTPRSLGFQVYHDPEHGNFAHCTVEGENSPEKCVELSAKSWPVDVPTAERKPE